MFNSSFLKVRSLKMPTAALYLLHFNTCLVWEPARLVAGYVTSFQSSLKTHTTELLPAPATCTFLRFMGQFQPLPTASVLTDILPLSRFCEENDAIDFWLGRTLAWDTAARISHVSEVPPALLQPQHLENIGLCCYRDKTPQDFCWIKSGRFWHFIPKLRM